MAIIIIISYLTLCCANFQAMRSIQNYEILHKKNSPFVIVVVLVIEEFPDVERELLLIDSAAPQVSVHRAKKRHVVRLPNGRRWEMM